MSSTPTEAIEAEEAEVSGERRPETRRRKPFWRELPVLIIIAFGVALLIKSFLLQAFYIPSASMEPTLEKGNRVLVEKVSYRFHGPRRGDVVVFERDLGVSVVPEQEENEPFWVDIQNGLRSLFGFPTGGTQDFIKRVVAVEGDTIEGKDGRVYVNGEVVAEPFLERNTITSSFGPFEVPPGHVFVMGDNRGNSDDSRSFGSVDADEIVGRGLVLIWPPSEFSGL